MLRRTAMFPPLRYLFRHTVRDGQIEVFTSDGKCACFGAPAPGVRRPIRMRILDRASEIRIARNPPLGLGEAYMEGRLTFDDGRLYEGIALLVRSVEAVPLPRWAQLATRVRGGLRRIAQFNPEFFARRRISHHYDIEPEIFDLFLDETRQYSCAYFATPDMTLGEAQRAKLRHIAAKLDIQPGQRILDIGSGWGGLALYLARMFDVEVMGITLSAQQIAWAEREARRLGLSRQVTFQLMDYRALRGRFDRIVSIGMFEHVGVNHFQSYFGAINDHLASDGVALVHAIGRPEGPGATSPFIAKYIFPGGYIPALSETFGALEPSGLYVTDTEILRLHYAETLRHWRQRFMANRDMAVRLKGERFARMWEFYLAASEAAFRYQGMFVFQIQMTRAIETLPLTRDYILAREAELLGLENDLDIFHQAAGE